MKKFLKNMVVLMVLALIALFGTPTQAATYTGFTGTVGFGYPGTANGRHYVVSTVITNLSTFVSNDVIQVIGITSGSIVRAVGFQVLSATTNGGVSFDIGDGSDTDGYVNDGSATNKGYGGSVAQILAGAFSAITGITREAVTGYAVITGAVQQFVTLAGTNAPGGAATPVLTNVVFTTATLASYLTNMLANTVATSTNVFAAAVAYAEGKFYSDNDTIDLIPNATAQGGGYIRVWADIIDNSGQ